jgi:hypothetical protein
MHIESKARTRKWTGLAKGLRTSHPENTVKFLHHNEVSLHIPTGIQDEYHVHANRVSRSRCLCLHIPTRILIARIQTMLHPELGPAELGNVMQHVFMSLLYLCIILASTLGLREARNGGYQADVSFHRCN